MSGIFRRWWRWRPLIAYGVVGFIVATILVNFLFDYLVSRYERNAARDPGSTYLKGMSPRELGPAESGRAVLFVHGFSGAQSNYSDLPDRVAAAGWFVRAMRLPGHGTTPREFERTTADALVAGVLSELRALKERYPVVVVVGHSMGGALATIAAADEPVDGLVLCAPFFGLSLDDVPGVPADRLLRTGATMLRWVPGRPGHGPVKKKENRRFVECYGWIPVQAALTALEVRDRAKQPPLLASITSPLLLIHSRLDSVTSPRASAAVFPAFGSAKKEIIWLERSDHVIFWDYENERVVRAVLAFLQEVEIP